MELDHRKDVLLNRLKYGQKGYIDVDDLEAQHQIHVNIERIRVPEALFQPHIIGIDQAGIMENIETILSLYTAKEQDEIVQVRVHMLVEIA